MEFLTSIRSAASKNICLGLLLRDCLEYSKGKEQNGKFQRPRALLCFGFCFSACFSVFCLVRNKSFLFLQMSMQLKGSYFFIIYQFVLLRVGTSL